MTSACCRCDNGAVHNECCAAHATWGGTSTIALHRGQNQLWLSRTLSSDLPTVGDFPPETGAARLHHGQISFSGLRERHVPDQRCHASVPDLCVAGRRAGRRAAGTVSNAPAGTGGAGGPAGKPETWRELAVGPGSTPACGLPALDELAPEGGKAIAGSSARPA